MQTKTYFASSVPAALETARRELGADALLLNSRPAPLDVRHLGRLEVTFASERIETAPSKPCTEAATRSKPPASDLDEIRQQLSALRHAIDRGRGPTREGSWIVDRLADSGLDPTIAQEIGSASARRPGDPEAEAIEELSRHIPVAPFLEMKPGESRTLALIGPPGRGKTTSLIKIGVRFGLARRIPVRIYSAGPHGVGQQEQMARYAAILGVPHFASESLEILNLSLNGEGWKGLRLIDTPGLSPQDDNGLRAFGTFFSNRSDIERHLVLRADTRSADMLHVLSRFRPLEPTHLLFTGLDEALNPVSIVNILIHGGVPAGFIGTGQQIPEDLEELSPSTLARSIWAAAAGIESSSRIGPVAA
jgi:flagellar biosynthesis protein FlhF